MLRDVRAWQVGALQGPGGVLRMPLGYELAATALRVVQPLPPAGHPEHQWEGTSVNIADNPIRDATPDWWFHEREHPRWCAVAHSAGDRSSDRDCVSAWEREIPLSHSQWRAVVVHLYQPYGACTPRIVLTPDSTGTRGCYEFSRAEAEVVGRALFEAVFLLDRSETVDV